MSYINSQSGKFTTPMAVVTSGVIIALAIFFGPGVTDNSTGQLAQVPGNQAAPAQDGGPSELLAQDVTKNDHILGNQNADIFLIEYSDLDCPFCGSVHPTLGEVVAQNDNVGWVYRHNPLESIHPNARGKAVISECVAQIAGNDAFWKYLELNFGNGDATDYSQYGTTQAAIDNCVVENGDEINALIDSQISRALGTGGQGTPHTIISNDAFGIAVSGAQPLDVFTQIIEFMNQTQG
jgi:protein-disulfide isomerase